jgi:cytochrome c biogenesis protein CcmG/thiol:disulfide interchange protein DsbE
MQRRTKRIIAAVAIVLAMAICFDCFEVGAWPAEGGQENMTKKMEEKPPPHQKLILGHMANVENITARDILQRALETVKNRPPMMANGEVHGEGHYGDKKEEEKFVSRVCIRNQQHDITRETWDLRDGKWVKTSEHRGIWDDSRYTARSWQAPFETESGFSFPGDLLVIYDDKPRTVDWATLTYGLSGTTWRGKHFAEEMLESETLRLRAEMEQVDGFDCYVVEGNTLEGHKTVWIDPQNGYLHRKMTCEGDPNDPNNLPGDEVTNVKIEYLDGIPVATEAERYFFHKLKPNDGNTPNAIWHEKMSNIVWNPDFESLGAFKMDKVPNGTRVIYRVNDLDKTGVKFHWQDGRIVPNVDEEATEQTDRMTKELMTEGQVSTGLEAAKKTEPLIGKAAPSFTLQDLDGKQVSLSDFQGKVVLLDFWATWCGPCVRGIPHLEALHKKYKDQGLVLIGVNNETDHAKVKEFARERISYVVLLDADKPFKEYGTRSIPTLFYIDRNGKVHHRDVGFSDGNEKVIERKVKELLHP